MKFEITQDLAQALLNYLAKKPYRETFQLIAEIQKLKPIEEEPVKTQGIELLQE